MRYFTRHGASSKHTLNTVHVSGYKTIEVASKRISYNRKLNNRQRKQCQESFSILLSFRHDI